jgi:hypothetical protein
LLGSEDLDRLFFVFKKVLVEMDLTQIVTSLIAIISPIVCAWFVYNQKAKDAKVQRDMERWKKEEEQKAFMQNKYSGQVFGQIHSLLRESKADRVYIVQPHPLGHVAFLSCYFEAVNNGITEMQSSIQSIPMNKVPWLSSAMAENVWLYYDNIDEQVNDDVAKSLFLSNGTHAVGIKRMDNTKDWVGSIFIEYIEEPEISEQELKKLAHDSALVIRHILPEFKEHK